MRRLIMGCGLAAAPAASAAVDDPWLRVAAGAGYACFVDGDDTRYHGVGYGVDALYGVNSAFVIRGGYLLGDHRTKGASFQVHTLTVAPRYQLDVLAFVPWVELAPALFLADGADGRPDATLSVALGFGIDWLIDEHWSLTPYLDLHQVGGVDRTPGYLVAGVRFGWRWTLGDPFAP
ncbi:MAG: outer membrane beta-barrel protein [Myxococcales bacterium]|nr:outer membrane beta-barrel protein [Myxococcales bacterium]